MRRRAVMAGWGIALVVVSGCAGLRKKERDDPSPAAVLRRQELSEAAQSAIDRRDLAQARGLLDQWIAENARSAEAHQRMGQVLQLQGALDAAAVEYRKALEIDKDYVDALIGLGRVLHLLGQDDAALKQFAQAIEIDPHEAEAHFAEGQIFRGARPPDHRPGRLLGALENDPTSAETIVRVATLQLARNQPDQALARLDQALQFAPEDAEAHHRRGLGPLHLALNFTLEAAVADLKAAAAKLPDRPDVFLHSGQGPRRGQAAERSPRRRRGRPEAQPLLRRRPRALRGAPALRGIRRVRSCGPSSGDGFSRGWSARADPTKIATSGVAITTRTAARTASPGPCGSAGGGTRAGRGSGPQPPQKRTS